MSTATTTTAAKRGRPRKSDRYNVEAIRDLVIFLRENHVKRFKHDNLEIEIDTIVSAASNERPDGLDEKAERVARVLGTKESPEDVDRDLFWSSGAK